MAFAWYSLILHYTRKNFYYQSYLNLIFMLCSWKSCLLLLLLFIIFQVNSHILPRFECRHLISINKLYIPDKIVGNEWGQLIRSLKLKCICACDGVASPFKPSFWCSAYMNEMMRKVVTKMKKLIRNIQRNLTNPVLKEADVAYSGLFYMLSRNYHTSTKFFLNKFI